MNLLFPALFREIVLSVAVGWADNTAQLTLALHCLQEPETALEMGTTAVIPCKGYTRGGKHFEQSQPGLQAGTLAQTT